MVRSALGEVAEGVRSSAEGDLHSLIKAARLPMPLFNAALFAGSSFLGRPDAWWGEAGVAVEVDSVEWHLSPADWDRTRKRHDVMGAAGIIVLHFSPRQIRREPAEVARVIRQALGSGRQRAAVAVHAVPVAGTDAAGVA